MDVTGKVDTLKPVNMLANSFKWAIPGIADWNNSRKVNRYRDRRSEYDTRIDVISPSFTTPYSNRQVEWRLKITWINSHKYGFSLECLHDITIKATVEISFEDSEIHSKKLEFEKQGFVSIYDAYEDQNYPIEMYIAYPIEILCKISFESQSSEMNSNQKGLQDFEKLLESGDLSDVTFDMDGKKIHAHKAFLSSRSPVFQAMFHHDMIEKQENTVKVKEISYEVMKELFRYIYACKVNGIEKIAMELLVAADKYSIPDLHKLCEVALIDGLKDLNVNNAIENLIIATTYDVPNFKTEVMKFVICNLKDITKTPQFKSLHPDILCNLLDVIGELKIDASSLV